MVRIRIVHVADTSEGFGIYVGLRSYGVAKGERPFLLASDKNGRLFKIYLNESDREAVLCNYCCGAKITLTGRYRLLKKAVYVLTEEGWKKQG